MHLALHTTPGSPCSTRPARWPISAWRAGRRRTRGLPVASRGGGRGGLPAGARRHRAVQRGQCQRGRARGPRQPLGAAGVRRARPAVRLAACLGATTSAGSSAATACAGSAWRCSSPAVCCACGRCSCWAGASAGWWRSSRPHAGDRGPLRHHPQSQLSRPAGQCAGLGAGVPLAGRRGAGAADGAAAGGAHACGGSPAGHALRRRIRRLPGRTRLADSLY